MTMGAPGLAQPLAESGAPSAPLTLEQAVRRAIEWHPSVEVAVGQLGQSEADVGVAKAGYRPHVRAGVSPGWEISDGMRWRPQLQVSASQMLYDFGKVRSEVDAAEASARESRALLLAAVDDLVRDTAYAVIETQRYKALLVAAQDQLAAIEEISRLVKQRAAKGATTRAEAVQAEARVEDAQSTILQIRSELERWRNTLAHVVGGAGLPDVADDMPAWHQRACAASTPDWNQAPQVLRYVARHDQAEANLRQARAQAYPTATFEVSGVSYLRDPIRGNSDVTVGVSLSSNLFDGGATRSRRESAALALRAADAALDNARNDASRALSEARAQVASLGEALDILSNRQGNMQETSKLYRYQYFDLGTRTLVDLLNAEQELHQARFDYINRQHDLRKLNADCLYSAGLTRDAFALTGMRLRGATL